MGRINGIPRFIHGSATFQREKFWPPTTFVTSIVLENMGNSIADVITTLPYWQENWARDTFELVIKLHLAKTQFDDHREDYNLLVAELQRAFNKIRINRVPGVIDISIHDATLPANKSAQAEAFHNMAVEILKKY